MTHRSILIALAASVLLTTSAAAQDIRLGVFFSASEFTDATTNVDPGADPFDFYIVVLGCEYGSVGGYECSLDFAGVAPTILGVDGPPGSGFTNFGDDQNHLVVFAQAPVVTSGAAVLGVVTIQTTAPTLIEVVMGVSDPTTVPDHLMIVNGSDPDDYVACGLTSDAEIPGVVATINGGGITAVQSRRLAAIRKLFD